MVDGTNEAQAATGNEKQPEVMNHVAAGSAAAGGDDADVKMAEESGRDVEPSSSNTGAVPKSSRNDTEPGPSSTSGTGSVEATGVTVPSARKKRFLSRNYRNHDRVESSSSDESDTGGPAAVYNKKSRKAVQTSGNPPPPEYREEMAAENQAEEAAEVAAAAPAAADRVEVEANNEAQNNDNDELTSNSSSSSTFDTNTSDSDPFVRDNDSDSNGEEEDVKFLDVDRPKCSWVALRELFYREHGLSGMGRRSKFGRDPQMFKKRVCGSLNVVERLELMYKMEKHDGCVNSLNFSHDGRMLASGSDDLDVIIWKWRTNTVATSFSSGHANNVFQTKFYGAQLPDLRLITSARDGLVRNFIVPSCGKPYSTTLFKHIGSVHRVAVCSNNPFNVLTAGEDGMVISVDLREKSKPDRLVTVKENKRKLILYGIAANPMNDEFLVYGRHKSVKIYDRRNTKTMIRELYPEDVAAKRSSLSSITCAVYNHLGTEVVASYSDEDIYLFKNDEEPGHYVHRYRGHLNTQTIKGVNFYGAGSEFIVSGSDCGYIYFWDKKTGKIVQFLRGDENGAINVLGETLNHI